MKSQDKDVWLRWKKEDLEYHGRNHAEGYAESDQTRFYSPSHVTIRNWLSEHLKVEGGGINRLLDLGCGTGRWFYMMENADFILGADFSSEMLSKAKEKILMGADRTKNINLVRCDIFNLPLKKDLFDCVVSVGTLGWHVPLNDEIFEEVGRVLKRDGRFLFTAKKVNKFLKLKIKVAQLLLPILPNSFKEKHEFDIKTYHTRLDHTEKTIRDLANRWGFDIYEIKIDFMVKTDFYFVCAQKRVK